MPGLRAPLDCCADTKACLSNGSPAQQEQEQDRQPASAPQPAPKLPPWPPAGIEVFRLPTLLPHAVLGQCHTCNLRRHARSEGAAGLELPEPVLTSDMMPHFEDVAIIPNPGERAEAMHQLINRLPTANRLLLQYMFKHMGHIIARHLVSRPSLSSPYPRWTLGKDVTNPQPPASSHTS
ncbi:SH3 domain-binding protein 1-like [Eriocheir sinensis]|uniref:SH3 domain-binding protein 1-like n=1 Tax=Eriocheir sinensis TaxID=95602 RepID=UPI0021C8703A|nr:SH3 domain-binding protein 1-like [Eriocheir sinensis]XP_050710035.1 SH3 domain-binding protein 1-like [Eriocheir sinensis]XP_050710036.1 SH3 domain-binding protein 1-like [Eriocheir sinensis]XP_050710038.1 SH3 domain-binding protein 1-like [Eriocheir sinensis]